MSLASPGAVRSKARRGPEARAGPLSDRILLASTGESASRKEMQPASRPGGRAA